MDNKGTEKTVSLLRRFVSVLGPGLITGAADDDPSGIATYSIAGAQLGTSLLWTAFITWPLMGCVQFMCARIGTFLCPKVALHLGRLPSENFSRKIHGDHENERSSRKLQQRP
jgi:Mn2+/Fe2+ NRAMP family transporter